MRAACTIPVVLAVALAAGEGRAAPTPPVGVDWAPALHVTAERVDRVVAWVPVLLARWTAVGDVSAACVVALRDAAVAMGVDAGPWSPLPQPPLPDLTVLAASPVPGVESSGFGWRRDPIHRRNKFHKGTDFRADRGTPVFAAGAGIVTFAGVKNGYGKVVYLDHGGGVTTRYAHLSKIEVTVGTAVPANLRVGRVGATGRATGPHLHFEVRLDDRAVDPEAAMRIAELQRTNPAAARLAAWALAPEAQGAAVDRHDPPRQRGARGRRPERRGAPARDRNRV